MVTWNIVSILVVCLLVAPSSTRSINLSTRVLELLRNKYADQLPQGDVDLNVKQQDYDRSQTDENVDLASSLSRGISKRNTPSLRELLLAQRERRGRLSIGMTLDALSDMLSAESRRHQRQQALKAQDTLHRLGKRSLPVRGH